MNLLRLARAPRIGNARADIFIEWTSFVWRFQSRIGSIVQPANPPPVQFFGQPIDNIQGRCRSLSTFDQVVQPQRQWSPIRGTGQSPNHRRLRMPGRSFAIILQVSEWDGASFRAFHYTSSGFRSHLSVWLLWDVVATVCHCCFGVCRIGSSRPADVRDTLVCDCRKECAHRRC